MLNGINLNSPIEDIIQEARDRGLPEDVVPHIRTEVERLRFAIQTEYDTCKGAVSGVFAAHGVDLDNLSVEQQDAIHSTLLIMDKIVGLLVMAHAIHVESGDTNVFQEALTKHAVFGEVMSSVVPNNHCDDHHDKKSEEEVA